MRRLAVLALGVLSPLVLIAASTGYHVVGEVKIGGDGSWDYLTVDSAARRLCIRTPRTSRLSISTLEGRGRHSRYSVFGIAIAPELNRGFVSNGRGNNVTIFG